MAQSASIRRPSCAALVARQRFDDTHACRLEQKGFLARHRSEGDRRQVQLKLTEQGQQLADRLPHIGADAMNELAAPSLRTS